MSIIVCLHYNGSSFIPATWKSSYATGTVQFIISSGNITIKVNTDTIYSAAFTGTLTRFKFNSATWGGAFTGKVTYDNVITVGDGADGHIQVPGGGDITGDPC